jgi:hypothetical protein
MKIHRRRYSPQTQGNFFQFQSADDRRAEGFGDGGYVRLRDTSGNVWHGSAEKEECYTRYRFRDGSGHMMTGVADGNGIVLKDDHGITWRGYIY